MEVRRAGPADWRAARDVRLAALADAPYAFGSTHARELRFEESVWRDRLAGSAWFIAWSGNEPVGVVVGIADPDGRDDERHVVSMWVAPQARGTGAAEALFTTVRDWARAEGAARVSLWVADGNSPAHRFYRRMGLRPTGRRQPLPSNPAVGEEELHLPLPAADREITAG